MPALMAGLRSLIGGKNSSTEMPPPSAPSSQRQSREMARAEPAAPIPTERAPAVNSKEQAEALVRRENEARAKREAAAYEGLPEGLTLGIKMGDGAFSNVYQATLVPTAAQLLAEPGATAHKVAVKCVRKYELNHSQVRTSLQCSRRRQRRFPY